MDTSVRIPAGMIPSSSSGWHLTQPHPSIQSVDIQRRVRLLLNIYLVSIIAAGVATVSVQFLITNAPQYKPLYMLPTALYVLLAIPGFLLSRTPAYLRGAYLMVALIAGMGYGSILTTPGENALAYVALPIIAVLVAGLFMSIRATTQLAAAVTGGLALTLILRTPITGSIFVDYYPGFTRIGVHSIVVSLLLVTSISAVLLLSMRLRDLLEADRLAEQNRALEQEQIATVYKRAEEVKSMFLASMSHELRTPLNAIINFTRFVAKGSMGPVNDEQVETLNEVVSSAKHLLSLINDVLDMSKIEAGALKLFVEQDVDVAALAKSVLAVAGTLIGEKTVDIRSSIAPDLPLITGDRQRIYQILLNITSNACKFTEVGFIELRVYAAGDELMIALQDTGPGIAPEDQSLVFEAFRQTEAGLQKGGGTGLGMSISRSLAEAHGGRLWLESSPGEGTTFFLSLPIRSAHLEPSLIV
jgi:signal transduction histidine kinase